MDRGIGVLGEPLFCDVLILIILKKVSVDSVLQVLWMDVCRRTTDLSISFPWSSRASFLCDSIKLLFGGVWFLIGITDIHFRWFQYFGSTTKRNWSSVLSVPTGLREKEVVIDIAILVCSGYVIWWTNIKCHKICCKSVTHLFLAFWNCTQKWYYFKYYCFQDEYENFNLLGRVISTYCGDSS